MWKCLDESSPIVFECYCGLCKANLKKDENFLPLRHIIYNDVLWSRFEAIWMECSDCLSLPQHIYNQLHLYLDSPYEISPLFKQTEFLRSLLSVPAQISKQTEISQTSKKLNENKQGIFILNESNIYRKKEKYN